MKKILSYLIPIASVVIFISAYFFLEPTTTGLVILEPGRQDPLVNADVSLTTKQQEVIPPNAVIEVSINNNRASMSIAEFIKKTGAPSEIAYGELPEFNFYGKGFTGDHEYKLTLDSFDLNRNLAEGEHRFTTRIIYQGNILFEKQNSIMISR
jgi:TusA-related sulfurtransferase